MRIQSCKNILKRNQKAEGITFLQFETANDPRNKEDIKRRSGLNARGSYILQENREINQLQAFKQNRLLPMLIA